MKLGIRYLRIGSIKFSCLTTFLIFFLGLAGIDQNAHAFGKKRNRIQPHQNQNVRSESTMTSPLSASEAPTASPSPTSNSTSESPVPADDRVACHALNDQGANWVGTVSKFFENDIVEVEWNSEDGYKITPVLTYTDLTRCFLEVPQIGPHFIGQTVLYFPGDPSESNSIKDAAVGTIHHLFNDGIAEIYIAGKPQEAANVQALPDRVIYTSVTHLAGQTDTLGAIQVGQTVFSQGKNVGTLVGKVEKLFDGGMKGGTAEVRWQFVDGKPKKFPPHFWPVASLHPEVKPLLNPPRAQPNAAPQMGIASAPPAEANQWPAPSAPPVEYQPWPAPAENPAVPHAWGAPPIAPHETPTELNKKVPFTGRGSRRNPPSSSTSTSGSSLSGPAAADPDPF